MISFQKKYFSIHYLEWTLSMFGHMCFAKTACSGSHSWKVRLYVFITPKYKACEQKSIEL